MGNSTSSSGKDRSLPASGAGIKQHIPIDERKHVIRTKLAEQPKSGGPTKYSEMKQRSKSRKREYEWKKQAREAKVNNVQARWEENRRQL